MVTPPAGAGAESETAPVVLTPPGILVEASVSDERLGAGGGLPTGNSVSPAPGDLYPSNAVPASIVTCVGTETVEVRTSNVAPVPPAGMKTVGGSVINGLSLFTSATSTPPGGAGFNNVATPSTEPPPTTASWSSAMPQRIGNKPSELSRQPRP